MEFIEKPHLFILGGWDWEDISDNNENDKGCDTNIDFDDSESFYAESEYAKDTPKQTPKALRNHPPGGRLAPTPDEFQVNCNTWWSRKIETVKLGCIYSRGRIGRKNSVCRIYHFATKISHCLSNDSI